MCFDPGTGKSSTVPESKTVLLFFCTELRSLSVRTTDDGDGTLDGGDLLVDVGESHLQGLLKLVQLENGRTDVVHDPALDVGDVGGEHLGQASEAATVVRGAIEHDTHGGNAADLALLDDELDLLVSVQELQGSGTELCELLELRGGEGGLQGAGIASDDDLSHSDSFLSFLGFCPLIKCISKAFPLNERSNVDLDVAKRQDEFGLFDVPAMSGFGETSTGVPIKPTIG